jgi:hypothetical protein
MALNPNISLAVKGIELQDPLAQYGKFAAIQNAQQQNQLAQMQMQEYERTRAEEEGARNYLAQSDLSKPENRTELARRFGRTGMAYGAAFNAQEKAALEQEETRGKIAETQTKTQAAQFDLQNKKLNYVLQIIGNSSTPQDAIAQINKGVKEGYISMAQGTAKIQKLQNMQPTEFAQFRNDNLIETLGALDQLNQSKQTTQDTDLGGFIQRQVRDAQGRPIGAPERLPKTPSFSDVTAQKNLLLAQQKFDFERANPGITVQQTEDGTLVGVNNRTGVAMPITLDGAAPMAPAAAPVSNQFSPRGAPSAAPAVTQAIPGMRSVLDQTAPAAPAQQSYRTSFGESLNELEEDAELGLCDMELIEKPEMPSYSQATNMAAPASFIDDSMFDDAEEQKRRAAERIQKLRNLSFNMSGGGAESGSEFDNVPAYVRRNMELFGSTLTTVEDFYSKYTVGKDEKDQTQISTLNTFLHGKKPD